jgi:uncharacterized protein YndB with AHSA1/START domain
MQKLFVDKTIEIEAPLFGVWDVLIRPAYTRLWAPEFYGGSPFRIESEWRIGAPVLWKDGHDQIIVEGNVTRLEPEKILRFTVFDVHSTDRPTVTEEDGITFELLRRETHTLLHLRQGDFSGMADGEQYRQMSEQVWDRVLPQIKQLAEGSAREM